jgi:hypothetical protein
MKLSRDGCQKKRVDEERRVETRRRGGDGTKRRWELAKVEKVEDVG